MLLEVGTTVRDGVPDYRLTRDAVSLETPDGKTIPLASIEEYRKANLRALQNREKVQRDSINYFPPSASRACRIGFFSELNHRAMAWDEVELSYTRGCVGRLFFQVPGGITYGQHWLNVKFEKSLVRVPFRILTEGRREAAVEELQGHPQAGRGRVQAEEVVVRDEQLRCERHRRRIRYPYGR